MKQERKIPVVNIVYGPRATIATAYLRDHESTGEAIRATEDKYDAEVAEKMAMGRALENLGKKLQRQAWGKIKHNEDVANINAVYTCGTITKFFDRPCERTVQEPDEVCWQHK